MHKEKQNEEEMVENHRKIIMNLKEGKLKLGTGGGNCTTGGNICHFRGRMKEEENRKEEVDGKVTEGSDSAVDNAKLESPNRIDLIDTPNREIEVVLPEGGVKIDQKPEGGESRNLEHFSPENTDLNVSEMACYSDNDPQCPDLEDSNVNYECELPEHSNQTVKCINFEKVEKSDSIREDNVKTDSKCNKNETVCNMIGNTNVKTIIEKFNSDTQRPLLHCFKARSESPSQIKLFFQT